MQGEPLLEILSRRHGGNGDHGKKPHAELAKTRREEEESPRITHTKKCTALSRVVVIMLHGVAPRNFAHLTEVRRRVYEVYEA